METTSTVYEVGCNKCLEKYTSETGRKLKQKMKEMKMVEKTRKKIKR